jgi:hypothetical protein
VDHEPTLVDVFETINCSFIKDFTVLERKSIGKMKLLGEIPSNLALLAC